MLVYTVVDVVGKVFDEGLHQRDEAQCIVEVAGNITDADLDRAELVVGANVPPDFPYGLYITRFDEVIHQPDIFTPVPHQRRQTGGGQAVHDLGPP